MASSRDASRGKKAGVGPGKPASRPPRRRPRPATTELQDRFAIEFCVDFNVRKAWERAHDALSLPRPKSVHGAYTALRNDHVLARIQRTRLAAQKAAGITVEKTETEIARLAYVDIGQFYDDFDRLKPIHDIPEDARRAIVSIETEELFDFSDEEDVRKRLEQIERTAGQLVAGWPNCLETAHLVPIANELRRLLAPRKVGEKRQKYLVGHVRKLKIADKKGALELAGRRDAIFKDKVEHSGSVSLETIIAESHKVTS